MANYDEVNTNEVLMKYYLEIKTTSTNSPLVVELQNLTTGEKINLTNGKTPEIELPYGSQTITNYRLTLKWDKTNNDPKFAGINLKYTINLVATQKRIKV